MKLEFLCVLEGVKLTLSTQREHTIKLIKCLTFLFLTSVLVACGGSQSSGSDGDGGLLPTSIATPNPTVTIQPTPVPTPTPTPVTPPPIDPVPLPSPAPPAPTGLTKPIVSASQNNGRLTLLWNETSANSHRVLYWLEGNARPTITTTNARSLNTVVQDSGMYTIIVEANDAFGNSIFSDAVSLEVTQ